MENTVGSENKCPSDGLRPPSGFRLELPVRTAQIQLHNRAVEKNVEDKRKKLRFLI